MYTLVELCWAMNKFYLSWFVESKNMVASIHVFNSREKKEQNNNWVSNASMDEFTID